MIVTQFHENRLIIDGEINEKHALLVECGPGYNYVRLKKMRAIKYLFRHIYSFRQFFIS